MYVTKHSLFAAIVAAIVNILICAQKMNEGLTGLEQHEGE